MTARRKNYKASRVFIENLLGLELIQEQPKWLVIFVTAVLNEIVSDHELAPAGCHIFYDADLNVWEVSLFLSQTEIYSGPHEGLDAQQCVQMNVGNISETFDLPPRICWQVGKFLSDDDLGNHLAFEGVVGGIEVWLRILQTAPEWSTPGRIMNSASHEICDLW